MSDFPKIAIIGAGPGGLTLARLLYVRGINATVFESDAAADTRIQGGSLDLHTESGLAALEAGGLTDAFERVARPEDQGVRLYDRDGVCVFDDGEEMHEGRPEIDRGQLRDLLTASLPSDYILWNARVQRIDALAGGDFRVHTRHGVARDFDLVIGAEGTWSKTRSLLTDIMPAYTGVTFVDMHVADVDRDHPDLARRVGRGKFFALADGKALIAQRNAGGKVHVYIALWTPETGIAGFDPADPKTAKSRVTAQLDGWAPDLVAFVHAAGHVAMRPIHAFDPPLQWQNRPGVTLLGDAAHVMSPFAGEGVNNAMLDALHLVRAIASDDWRAGIRAYEAGMFERIPASAAASAANMTAFLASDGLANALTIFKSHAPN